MKKLKVLPKPRRQKNPEGDEKKNGKTEKTGKVIFSVLGFTV
jgi:hypothetical protein